MDQNSINALKQPLLSEDNQSYTKQDLKAQLYYTPQSFELPIQNRGSKEKSGEGQEYYSVSSGSLRSSFSIRSVQNLSPQPQIEKEPPSTLVFKRDRLQEIKNYKYLKSRPQRKAQIELDITQILIREMRENQKVITLLGISFMIDTIVRFNSLIYLILLLNEKTKVALLDVTLVALTLLPRMFNFMSKIKLLTVVLHKTKYYSILKIAILYQQNFSDDDLDYLSKLEWYDWKRRRISFKFFIWKLMFVFLPMELTIIPLKRPINKPLSKNAVLTYMTEGFILNTIEMICFLPFFVVLLYVNRFDIQEKQLNDNYNRFTLILQYIEVFKYFMIVFIFLTKRNYQLNFLKYEDDDK